jgi:hypothetical protein
MSRRLRSRRRRARPHRSRFFVLDGDLFLVTERNDDELIAARLIGADRDVVLKMMSDNDIEMESCVLRGRG